MYLGKDWRIFFSFSNPIMTHNYLEQTYTIDELNEGKQVFEATELKQAPFYEKYYVFK